MFEGDIEEQVSRAGMLFCLVGPSAGGKTSMGNYLLQAYPKSISRSISATTRARREGEFDGKDYHFLSTKDFKQKVSAGQFFEWAEVHGNLYGTLKEVVASSIAAGKDLLLDINLQGVRSFAKEFPENLVVSFIVPPNVAALKQRMLQRSAISDAELDTRIATAASEYEDLPILARNGVLQYFIVNDSLERSQRSVRAIYEAERMRIQRVDGDALKNLCSLQ